jgi:hypothetical protein
MFVRLLYSNDIADRCIQRPTLLAKIFGCYKLTFKKTSKDRAPSGKSKSTQMNLLVMENLFYDRRFSKVISTPKKLSKY